VKATENAKRMIVEVREAMEREEREESERNRTPKVKASALVVAVARGEQKQHWLLTYAKTIGDVWLEARGYSTVVRGHEVLVDFEKETDITPRPTTATHYVVPCVTEGARMVYHIPKTHTNGPLHTLSGGAHVSPLYDVARRSISSLRDPSSVQKFTVVLGIESSFGGAEEVEHMRRFLDSNNAGMFKALSTVVGKAMRGARKNTAPIATDADTYADILKQTMHLLSTKNDISDHKQAQTKHAAAYMLKHIREDGEGTGQFKEAGQWNGRMLQKALFGCENFKFDLYGTSTETIDVAHSMLLLLIAKKAHYLQDEIRNLQKNLTLEQLKDVRDALKLVSEASDASLDEWLQFHERLTRAEVNNQDIYFFGKKVTLEHLLCHTQRMFYMSRKDFDIKHSSTLLRRALKCDWSGESVFVRHIFEIMRQVCETNKDCCCLPLMLLACSDMGTDEVAEIMYFSATAECTCHTSFIAKLRDPYLEYGDDDAKDLTGVKKFLEVLLEENLTNLLGDKKFTGGFLGAAYLELNDKTKDSCALMGKQVAFLLDPGGSTQSPAKPPAVMRLAVKHGLPADTADAKSVIQKLFLFNENKPNTRESLNRIITYASAGHKDDRGILDHNSLKTFMFAHEVDLWQRFLEASEDNSALAELQKNVLLRTELERIMSGVEKFFRERIPTIGELLRSIRLLENETDAKNLRKFICDKLPTGEKTNYYPFFDTEEGKYPQVDAACEYKGLHLIEYTGKKDKDDALLSFIEGCNCNYKCLRELTARARKSPSKVMTYLQRFFKDVYKRGDLIDDKVRALKWTEAMCVNLQKVIICGSDANERQAFADICATSTVDFNAKFELEPSDCTDPGVIESLMQNTNLPKYATSKYKSELQDRVADSIYAKAITNVRNKRASTARKSRVVVQAEMDRAAAMQLRGLRYVHYTYIQSEKCDAGAFEAYIAALVTEESGVMDMFRKTLAHEELIDMGSTSRLVAGPRSRSILNTPGAGACYWKQIANDITRETVLPQTNPPSVKEIRRMSELLGERDDKSTPEAHHCVDFTKTAASKETLHATLICLRYELVGGDKNDISGLLNNLTDATQTNGNTTEEGALRLEWSLGTETIQRLLNERATPYLAWMLQCAQQTRKRHLESRTCTLLLSGEDGHKQPERADSISRLLDAFEYAMKNDFSPLELLIVTRKGMPRKITKGDDNVEARELRSVALVVREILRGDDGKLRGLLDEYLNAYSDRPIVPESLQRLDITRELSARQPSSLSNLVSGLDAKTRMALSRSRTVGDAQQAYDSDSSFGGSIKQVIFDLVKETEKRQEIPKNSRLQSAEQIDDDTPIESNPSGFVDLAFREGGLYQLLDQTLDRGKWVRVLAGTYGVEEYYAPFAFTYSARAVYTESGASATFTDKRSKNVHKGNAAYLQLISKMTRKRPSLGITVLDTRGANASVVGAMRVLAERARAASGSSSALWRLPCEATSGASTCGSVVYVCCDFSEHDRAKKHWDVVTLVLDAELGRVLEKHVDSRFGHGERSAREIIVDLRSAWDTVPQIKFAYEHVQPWVAQRHSDVKEEKEKNAKRKTRTEKVTVDAPELRLLHCFRHFVEANKESEKKLVYSLFERMALPEAAENEKMDEKWKKAISTAIGELIGHEGELNEVDG
jgi:hypothetical protein